jgi:hypothetical protein
VAVVEEGNNMYLRNVGTIAHIDVVWSPKDVINPNNNNVLFFVVCLASRQHPTRDATTAISVFPSSRKEQ